MNKLPFVLVGLILGFHIPPVYASDAFEVSFFVSPLIAGLALSAIFALRQLGLKTHFRDVIIIMITVGAIMQVLAVEQATEFQRPLILLGSTLLWLSIYLSDRVLRTAESKYTLWLDRLVVVLTIVYLLALLLLPAINGYVVWAGYGAFFIVMSLITLRAKLRVVPSQKLTEFAIISCFTVYAICGYLWLNAQLPDVAFILATLMTYVIALWGKLAESIILKRQHKEVRKAVEEPSRNHFLDPITNLPNYQHAVQKLKLLNHEAMKEQYIAIVFKPVNFNEVNRVLGHQTSDILLLQLAYNLQKAVSERRQLVNFNDSNDAIRIARLQGLEFLAVIDTSNIEHSTYIEVEDTCRKLLAAVPKALSFKSFSLNFDLVFGVSVSDAQFSDIELLIKYANDALLEAEQQQRQIVYFDYKTTIFAEQQLQNMEKLKLDISNEQLEWVVSPQVSMQSQQVKGVKIACEWRGLNGDVLSKKDFREVAEYSGEIYLLTKIAINKAFALLLKLRNQGHKCRVAIELASIELLQPELIDYIRSVADNVGVPTKYLMLDIDEQLLLSASERTKAFIDQMTNNEVSIAIDNFSGSYEALRYLRRSIVSQLKIDCRNLNEQSDSTDKIIINALINLIRKMDMSLVATNIDTQEAKTTYLSIGGDVGQGKVIHRHLSFDSFEDWLNDWANKHPISE